jgi:hypothetical protein
MLRRLYAYLVRQLTGPSTTAAFQGALLSVCLATSCLQLAVLLGTSLPVVVAMLSALALAIVCGSTPVAFVRRLSLPGLSNRALLHFALAAWMVASPWFVEIGAWVIAHPGAISLNSPAWNFVTLFIMVAAVLGLPAFIATQLAIGTNHASQNESRHLPAVFLGAALGLTVWSMGLAQIMGPGSCGILAACLGLGVALVHSFRSAGAESHLAAQISVCDAARLQLSAALPDGRFSAILRLPTTALLSVACGAWMAALEVLLEQLLPGTVYLVCSEAVGLCLGIAAGLKLDARRCDTPVARDRLKFWCTCGLAVWGVGLLGGFSPAITLALVMNSYISSPTLMLLARGALAALVVFPIGTVSALALAPVAARHPLQTRLAFGSRLVGTLLGFTAVTTVAVSRYSLDQVIIGLAWETLAAAGLMALAQRRELFTGWQKRILASAAVAVIVIAPAWRHSFDARRSAKLLFNSNVAYAFRTGFDPSLLMSLDDGRYLAATAGSGSICTVWRYGGHQLQIRDNGIPVGVVSTDAEAFPKFVPETLQAALPLALHEKAERVLLLGLGTGESLATALSFPVQEVVCLEANAALLEAVRGIVAADSGRAPLDDERLTFSTFDPPLGLSAAGGQFDAIVSSPGHLSLARSQASLTVEFYQRAARKLAGGGIFCQRLSVVDFGARPMQKIVKTLQQVFRDVLALEVAHCEFVLAATNDPRGLIRSGLLARLELPQMRAVCAQSGIDWSVILNLGAFNQEGLAKFTAESSPTPESAGNGRFPLALPREVIRWGPKLQELQDALAPSRNRLLSWVEDADSPVLMRRLAEVQGQFDLMTKYADQYWAYRASLRSQVKEKSRSQIQMASATDEEKQLHPEDRRRLRYFLVLGKATRFRRAADIERLARFAWPYDPLISYFVHEEAAELYSQSAERNVGEELRHRLYATFFSSPQDASLRNVVAALRLLREHPEAEPDPQIRWDVLNALLQALKLRWEARAGVRPTDAKEMIVEIDTTILAAEQTFHVLDNLTTEAGIPERDWRIRRAVLERTLIRPVKAYQRELLPYLHRRPAQEADGRNESQGAAPEDGT